MRKKKLFRSILLILLAVVLLLGLGIGGIYLYSSNYSIPAQAETIANTTGLVQASGRSLYDANGNALQLTGIGVVDNVFQQCYTQDLGEDPDRGQHGDHKGDEDVK